MIKKDAEVLAEHADEFLMKPPKSFKRKHALGAVEDLIDAGLITPKDLVKIAIKRCSRPKDIARYLIKRGHLELKCPRCGHLIKDLDRRVRRSVKV